MSWNYRLTKRVYNHKYLHEPKILFEIREIFYDKDGKINGYAELPGVISDSVEGMKDILTKMLESCDKPLIDYNTGEEI